MSIPTYRIRDWSKHFETSESNKRIKALAWVAMPTKHDGKAYRRIMRRDPSGALMGAFMLIIQVAAKCPVRGTLSDLDGPLTAIDISDKTGLSEIAVEKALETFSSDEIRWIESIVLNEKIGESTVHDITRQDITIHDITLQQTAFHAGVPAEQTDIPAASAGVPADLFSVSDIKASDETCCDILDAAVYLNNSTIESELNLPPKLEELIDAFNELPRTVAPQVRSRHSPALLKLWKKFASDREAFESVSDVPTLMKKITSCKFLHGQGWFRFEWLLKKGPDRVIWNAVKIMDDQYEQSFRATSQILATGRPDPNCPVADSL